MNKHAFALPPLTPRRAVAAWIPLLGASVAGFALAQTVPQPENSTTQLETVVVTAQKRQETAQTVPISMTAISETKLEKLGVETVSDLARQVPGLNVVSAGPGQNVLIIRGVSSTAGTAGTVGYYLDDTPISASSNASLLSSRGLIDPAVFDITRVEVLRGPQGSLYGSSSMGGTVKYVTNQPDTKDFDARASLTLSNTSGGGLNTAAKGMINVPLLGDTAAMRLSVFSRNQDGYIDRYPIAKNNINGVAAGSTPERDVNTERTHGARLQLRVELPDRWSITPSVFYQKTTLGAPFQIDVPPGSLDNLIQTRLVAEPSVQQSTLSNLSIHKGFDNFELVSSSSYYHRTVEMTEDASKVLDFFFDPGLQSYVYPAAMVGSYRNKEFTQEFRFASNFTGPFQLIAGAFYHDVRAPLNSGIAIPAGYEKAFGPIGFSEFYGGARQATLKEKALFAEASYQFTPNLTARLGLRAFQVDQTFAQQGDGLLNGGPSSVVGTSSDKGVNPKLNLSWQLNEDHMVYATAAKGYRPGGPNNPAPASVCGTEVAKLGLDAESLTKYKPDTLWNYEVGSKNSWLNRSLQVNASLYYIDWTKVQQQIVLNCGFNITANFGKAVSKGAELEVIYRPLSALTLSAGAGYTHATLGNDVPGTPAKEGDTLLNVPRWTGSASAEYAMRVWSDLPAFARLDYTFSGKANSLYDRASPFYQRAAYSITNLKFGVDASDHWRTTFFVDNVFNKIGQTDLPTAISADLPTTRRYAITRPRTIGMTLSYGY